MWVYKTGRSEERTQRGEADSCFHIRKYKRTRACPEASGGLSSYTSDGWLSGL